MKVIGAPIASLLEGQKVPPLIERLIQTIEQNGLYTTGIYRKAGAAARIRDLVHLMNAGEGTDLEAVCAVIVISGWGWSH